MCNDIVSSLVLIEMKKCGECFIGDGIYIILVKISAMFANSELLVDPMFISEGNTCLWLFSPFFSSFILLQLLYPVLFLAYKNYFKVN